MKPCPIGFGDCPDCIYHVAGECEYKEEDEKMCDEVNEEQDCLDAEPEFVCDDEAEDSTECHEGKGNTVFLNPAKHEMKSDKATIDALRDLDLNVSIQKVINDRPDSITISTPSKGGELKVYFNSDDPKSTTEQRIANAFAARKYAQDKLKEQEETK